LFYTPFSQTYTNSALLIGNIEAKRANQILKEHGFAALRLADNGPASPVPDFSHPHCYHLLPTSTGKRSAVKKDKEIRGLRKEELVGIGESIEDIEISSEVGVYFVVRNGAEEDDWSLFFHD
jgi:hydroxymethylpyrimidine pyrophosphatase-like HAD family hydrolase